MKKYNSMTEYYQDMATKPENGQWQTMDPNAIYPSERERAVKGARDYRVFYGPGQTRHPHLSWILVVREVGADGVETHIHHGAYRTDYEAKRAALQWGTSPE